MSTRLDEQCRTTRNLSDLRIETIVSFPQEMAALSAEGESWFANTVKHSCSGETEPKGKGLVSMVVMDDERFVHKRKSLPRALRGHRVGLSRDRAPRGGVFGPRRGGERKEGKEEGGAFHRRGLGGLCVRDQGDLGTGTRGDGRMLNAEC